MNFSPERTRTGRVAHPGSHSLIGMFHDWCERNGDKTLTPRRGSHGAPLTADLAAGPPPISPDVTCHLTCATWPSSTTYYEESMSQAGLLSDMGVVLEARTPAVTI